MTVLQPALRLLRCLIMQAVTWVTFGISELQSRNASPVHIWRASELKAWLAVGKQNTEMTNAANSGVLRTLLVMAVSPC